MTDNQVEGRKFTTRQFTKTLAVDSSTPPSQDILQALKEYQDPYSHQSVSVVMGYIGLKGHTPTVWTTNDILQVLDAGFGFIPIVVPPWYVSDPIETFYLVNNCFQTFKFGAQNMLAPSIALDIESGQGDQPNALELAKIFLRYYSTQTQPFTAILYNGPHYSTNELEPYLGHTGVIWTPGDALSTIQYTADQMFQYWPQITVNGHVFDLDSIGNVPVNALVLDQGGNSSMTNTFGGPMGPLTVTSFTVRTVGSTTANGSGWVEFQCPTSSIVSVIPLGAPGQTCKWMLTEGSPGYSKIVWWDHVPANDYNQQQFQVTSYNI